MRIPSRIALFLCVLLTASMVVAQIGTSTITGRVSDPTGAVVPNVAVVLVQPSTNFTFRSTTNNEGIYRFPSLTPGVYRITFEASGFKRGVREDFELRTGDTMAVDMVLQVGNVAESIEVSGNTTLLETQTSATGTIVSGQVIYDMPLYQRYVNSTMNLVPGMQSGGFAYGGSLGAYHLAGQRSGTIGIFEDGVSGNDQTGGTETIKPLLNAVAEVQVLTTVPPAEFGHSAGGVINVVKKSGTNELHGMGSFYGRTRAMQHRRWADRDRTSQPSPGRPNGLPVFFMQPDGNIAGPVYVPKVYDGRNKTFFFFGYQRLHEKKVAQFTETVYTPAMLQGDFNYPGVNSNLIYDPLTTAQSATGAWSRTPFPGNIVPLNRFDPVARKVLLEVQPYNLPNQPGSFNTGGPVSNLLADEFAKVFFDDYSVRGDHQFSPAFKVYGSYTRNNQSGFQRPRRMRDTPEIAPYNHTAGNYSPFGGANQSAGYTWVVSPTLINDSRAGYYRRQNSTQVPSFNQNFPEKLGIPGISQSLMPAFNIDRMGGATPSRTVNETLSWRNDTTWVRGKHAYKFGYEVLRFRLNNAIFARPVSFNFGATVGLQASGAALANTGNVLAGFQTGQVSSATITAETTSWLPRSSIHSFYIQDDWKVSPTLTANLGLRYSTESPFTTKYGGMSNFDPTATDPLTGRLGAIIHPTGGLNKRDVNNFNPRFGLAWHPLQKWVFRGGIGFYSVDVKFPGTRIQFDEYVATASQARAPGDPRPLYAVSRGPDPVTFNILPNGTVPFVGTNYSGRGASWWDQALRNPYTMNWNLSVQYEFIKDYLLEFSYQASAGVGLIENWQSNIFPIDFAAGNPTLQAQVQAQSQNFRPFNHFGNIPLRSNYGHSTFHSGTVKLEKRLSRGLYYNTFYTWAKAIDSQDTDGSGAGLMPLQNRNLEKARAGYDREHRFVGVVNWELPFGRGKRWMNSGGWKHWVFGGYEISWIQTLESGNPLNFGFSSPFNYYGTEYGARRPDLVGQPKIRDNWNDFGGDRFNTNNINSVFESMNVFAYPGGCTTSAATPTAAERAACDFRIGNAGRNIITGLPLIWSQVSAQKNFRINERWLAQLRWDFQNALKTFNWNPPSTSVDFRNPATFGKTNQDPTTASLGGQPLMNITVMLQF
jgi:hypothetical protein